MEKRKKAVLWSEGVLILIGILFIAVALLVSPTSERESQESRISTVHDLDNGTFATAMESSYELIIPELFPNAHMNSVTTWDEECLQVAQGKADALLLEASSINELLEAYPELMVLGESLGSLDFRWVTRKDARGKELCDEINSFIRPLRESGELEEVYKRWEDPENAPDHVDSYPMTVPYKEEIRVASCLDWQPVCYENKGNACGFMIEILYRFCAGNGYKLVPEYVDVHSLLAGLYSGKYDLLCYGFEYREESEESVYFTDTLMTDDYYAVIAKERYADIEAAEPGKDPGIAERIKARIGDLRTSFEKNFLREERWKMILRGFRTTLLLSLFSIFFGTLLGGLICLIYRSSSPVLEAFARIYIRVIEGMPIMLMLLILYYVIFGRMSISAFWVCILGFSLDFSAYAGEIFRSGIGAVPEGQKKAAVALGFSKAETFIHIVFPQMVIHSLPVYIGQVITTIKLTSVAGYISVQDLTRVSDMIRARTYDAFFPLIFTALVYFGISALMMRFLRILEKRIDPMKRKRIVRGVKQRADQG